MPYPATVIEVLIASPGDVNEERKIARDVILGWNQVHTNKDRLILLPRMWEIDATPQMGPGPQGAINDQLVKNSDLIVAIFWTRLGTPTANAISGTVEEIKQHLDAGRPALIYFSRKSPEYQMDYSQRDALKAFEDELRPKGLLGEFRDESEFKDRFRDALERTVHKFFFATGGNSESINVSLTGKALTLLSVTGKSSNLQLIKMRMAVGVRIWSENTVFTQGDDPKDVVGWNSAIQELLNLGFCRDLTGKDQIFELTQDGLDYLEKGLRDRFETGSDVYVVAIVRKSYNGNGSPPERRLMYIVKMPRLLIESEGIEWNYDFIIQDDGFRYQVLSRILKLDDYDSWPYGKSWQWEKLEFYESDPKSLGRDYRQMGNGCLIWEQKTQ
jgi:hypothetical protein